MSIYSADSMLNLEERRSRASMMVAEDTQRTKGQEKAGVEERLSRMERSKGFYGRYQGAF